jgi:hypothetical protein
MNRMSLMILVRVKQVRLWHNANAMIHTILHHTGKVVCAARAMPMTPVLVQARKAMTIQIACVKRLTLITVPILVKVNKTMLSASVITAIVHIVVRDIMMRHIAAGKTNADANANIITKAMRMP